jgi:hypothetical protein
MLYGCRVLSVPRIVLQGAIVQEVCVSLQLDSEIYRYAVGFPEYAFLTVRRLRAFAKSSTVCACVVRDVFIPNALRSHGTRR